MPWPVGFRNQFVDGLAAEQLASVVRDVGGLPKVRSLWLRHQQPAIGAAFSQPPSRSPPIAECRFQLLRYRSPCRAIFDFALPNPLAYCGAGGFSITLRAGARLFGSSP
jgi:hypothetical protein